MDEHIHYVIPIKIQSYILNQLLDAVGFMDQLVYGGSEHMDTHQVYTIAASPTSLD